MSYIISTICFGKYTQIEPIWASRVRNTCPTSHISIYKESSSRVPFSPTSYAWWDPLRLQHNLQLIKKHMIPIAHCDMDIIIEKDISSLIHLPYDILFSTEIGGNKAFPSECSRKIGFGICSGFYALKSTSSAIAFMEDMLVRMMSKKYGSFSDQETIMNVLAGNQNEYRISVEKTDIQLDGHVFSNNWVFHITSIISNKTCTLCVLDFDIITRDPICMNKQYMNHINIDNVGGIAQFLRFFKEPMCNLPKTCRCGKLGDTSVCNHTAPSLA